MRPRRVPYEWILAAMFVGTFFFRAIDTYVARTLWLLIVGPAAGFALGVDRDPGVRPRWGVPFVSAALGWVYSAVVVSPWFGVPRPCGPELVLAWPVAVTPALVCIVHAAVHTRRHRESIVFANAAVLLLFAFMHDAMETPMSWVLGVPHWIA